MANKNVKIDLWVFINTLACMGLTGSRQVQRFGREKRWYLHVFSKEISHHFSTNKEYFQAVSVNVKWQILGLWPGCVPSPETNRRVKQRRKWITFFLKSLWLSWTKQWWESHRRWSWKGINEYKRKCGVLYHKAWLLLLQREMMIEYLIYFSLVSESLAKVWKLTFRPQFICCQGCGSLLKRLCQGWKLESGSWIIWFG